MVKILLGQLQPDAGKITFGSKLEVAYSDQLRDQLDPQKNLIDNVCGGQDFIEINGKRRHAISYLGDFLFSPERVRTPVKALSGGEQNRAILARLFSKPANMLVLDEPTNDLDLATLALLEDCLTDFDGAILLVYPGGDREVFRTWRDRNRIDFGGRLGFVRLALRTGVPVVPAGSGAPVVKVGPHSPGNTRFTKNEKVRLLCTTPIQFQSNENESVALG